MARKAQTEKQQRREKAVASRWNQRQELKKTISSSHVSLEEKIDAISKLNSLPRDSSPVRLRNRCSLTGRSRGYIRKFKISRLCFREMASFGLIPGVTKSSW